MTDIHRNDQGAYTTTFFDELGRKVGHDTHNPYTEAVELCDDWKTENSRNSAVVHRCVYNLQTNLVSFFTLCRGGGWQQRLRLRRRWLGIIVGVGNAPRTKNTATIFRGGD